jgi:hypothetical protein
MSTITRVTPVACLVIFHCLAGQENLATAQLVADSVAQFSGTQSLNGWSYGYYDGDAPGAYTPADFELLPLFDGTKWLIEDTTLASGPPPHGYWTRLTATGGHPNGIVTTSAISADHWAVRRWSSTQPGIYTLSGILADDSPAIGQPGFTYNGVVGHIFVDGAEVLTLPINEGGTVNYSLTKQLNAGSTIDFAIDGKKLPNQERTSDWTDTTTFTIQIFVPEPSTISIVCTAFPALSARNLRSPVRRMQRLA